MLRLQRKYNFWLYKLFFNILFIGDNVFNVGDYVTRNSYNNDIVFQIIKIEDELCYLKGINVRLYADSYIDDLKLFEQDNREDEFKPDITSYRELDRDEFFYLPGKILHLDGDKDYLEKCMNFYRKNKIMAYGLYVLEEDMADKIAELIKKYNPDILVLTGHDSYSRNKRDKYKNTTYFVNAITEARKIEKAHDKLFIIAGGCQSNYEELIKAGANFASSPKRINIHALDPAIVASCLSFSNKNDDIDIIKILEKTKYGSSGMGGIITKGSMYIGYPR